ncbi:uncharacterized protein LOC117112541 [Anneissia japonica]|uniref:uncharacterized protein LOC117112541 n=1 Tax=Anneissia japonica TaxID=1529436 RepID=UPI001425A0C0|nr:uncharacterized protein LOC117112541 [Anneissia japonica]
MACEEKSFLEMRDEALSYFRDHDPVARRSAIVNEVASPVVHDLQQEVKNLKAELEKMQLSRVEAARPERRCFRCGARDHLKSSCKQPVKCFKCFGTGHLKRNCPQWRGSNYSPRPQQPSQQSSNQPYYGNDAPASVRNVISNDAESSSTKLLASSPTAMVDIAGVRLSCILDTGAETSIIPADIYYEKLHNKLGGMRPENTFLSMVGANGEPIPIEGYVEVPLQYGNQTIMASFLVASGQSPRQVDHPVLLGCNNLRALASLEIPEMDRYAWSTTIQGDVLISPAHKDVEVVEGCQTIKNNEVEVMVVNDVNHEIVLRPDTYIAEAVVVDSRQEVCLQVGDGKLQVAVNEVVVDPGKVKKGDLSAKVETNRSDSALPLGLKLDYLSDEEQRLVMEVVDRHRGAFSNGTYGVGECKVLPHDIVLRDGPPIRLPYRRIHPNIIPEVQRKLQEMLDQGIIRPSKSSYASPGVLVRKKDNTLRLCIDYRQLNGRTIKDSFPLPRIEEALEALGGASYFSTLDFAHGYF